MACDNSIEDLIRTNELLFPDKTVIPVLFGQPLLGYDIVKGNSYTAEKSSEYGYPALMLATPDMDCDTLEREVARGGFRGLKVYFEYAPAYLPSPEIRIYDYLTRAHLELADRYGWVVMLHIPRPARLRDEVNLAQMLEIDRTYKNARVIISHAGRAYCDEDVGDAYKVLSGTQNLLFDVSANTNSSVFEGLLGAVGTHRVMYGSDLPIFRMRGKRECVGGTYVNVVPEGLYGDVSGMSNMRAATGDEEEAITFMLYEEILALKRACERTGLTKLDVERLFWSNAASLFNIK
ncbi:MAG: amidohydrolase family protein [Eubacteriales bacterium]